MSTVFAFIGQSVAEIGALRAAGRGVLFGILWRRRISQELGAGHEEWFDFRAVGDYQAFRVQSGINSARWSTSSQRGEAHGQVVSDMFQGVRFFRNAGSEKPALTCFPPFLPSLPEKPGSRRQGKQTYLFDSLNLNGTATHTETGPFCISAGV